jgi:ABC-type phosphate/phosphonate transport system substrate-binding protein
MQGHLARVVAGVLAPLLMLQFGCQATGVAVLNLIGVADKPLVMTSVAEKSPLQLLDPFGPSHELNKALGAAVQRTVVNDMCFEFQLGPNLSLGTAHLANVSAVHYARLSDRSKYPVLAVSVDSRSRPARRAHLVVPANSRVERVADLRGNTIAFGPSRDGRTHHAALLLLRENGLSRQDLSLELFPVPGSLKTFPNARDVAQSVLNASSDAGFVDELDWEEFPEQPPRPGAIGQSALRIVASTSAVPERLILRSPTLDDVTAQHVADFLLRAGERHAAALKPMRIGGFIAPTPELLDACLRLQSVDTAPVSQPAKDAP